MKWKAKTVINSKLSDDAAQVSKEFMNSSSGKLQRSKTPSSQLPAEDSASGGAKLLKAVGNRKEHTQRAVSSDVDGQQIFSLVRVKSQNIYSTETAAILEGAERLDFDQT